MFRPGKWQVNVHLGDTNHKTPLAATTTRLSAAHDMRYVLLTRNLVRELNFLTVTIFMGP